MIGPDWYELWEGFGRVAKPTEKERKLCAAYGCNSELSEYLDAYHGRSPRQAALCAKCRPRYPKDGVW